MSLTFPLRFQGKWNSEERVVTSNVASASLCIPELKEISELIVGSLPPRIYHSHNGDTDSCPSIPLGCSRVTPDEFVGPLDEVLHVWSIGVAAIVLPPRKLPTQ
jgi:hypothetical protein